MFSDLGVKGCPVSWRKQLQSASKVTVSKCGGAKLWSISSAVEAWQRKAEHNLAVISIPYFHPLAHCRVSKLPLRFKHEDHPEGQLNQNENGSAPWVNLQRTREMLTTGSPRNKIGERDLPSN